MILNKAAGYRNMRRFSGVALTDASSGTAMRQNAEHQSAPAYLNDAANKLINQAKKASADERKKLLDKGVCCGEKCSACPYEPKWIKGSTQVASEEKSEPENDKTLPDNISTKILKAAFLKVAAEAYKPNWLERGAEKIVNSDLVTDFMGEKIDKAIMSDKQPSSGAIKQWAQSKINSPNVARWLQDAADKRLDRSFSDFRLDKNFVEQAPLWRRLVSGYGTYNRTPGFVSGTYAAASYIPAQLMRLTTDGLLPFAGGLVDKLRGKPGTIRELATGYLDPVLYGAEMRAQQALSRQYAKDDPLQDIKADLAAPWLPAKDRLSHIWRQVTRK